MNRSSCCLLALSALVWAGCQKTESAPPPPAKAAEPRSTWAEGLGFAADANGYADRPASATAAPAASAPTPAPASVNNPPSLAGKPIRHTITSRDGRTLDALLLSRSSDAVKVRRVADGHEFVLPFAKISEADESFIRQSSLTVLPGY